MKSILFHPEAEEEFDHSIGFYEERQIGLGLDFEREVRRSISVVHGAPARWPLYKYGLRKYTLQRFPFTIYYLDEPGLIWIVAITHCSRKPDYWKSRLHDKTNSQSLKTDKEADY